MRIDQLADQIIELKNKDILLRDELISQGKLSDGYHPTMEEVHNSNAAALNKIIDNIGFPTINIVGREASEAAWLIIQHAIGQPEFMRKCRDLLAKAVSEQKADLKSLAYLTDRIAVFEGKPQLYGTQFDWDENGKLSPNTYDDYSLVEQRRFGAGFNSLKEQTELIRKRAKVESQSPPKDMINRNRLMREWKIKVGWLK